MELIQCLGNNMDLLKLNLIKTKWLSIITSTIFRSLFSNLGQHGNTVTTLMLKIYFCVLNR